MRNLSFFILLILSIGIIDLDAKIKDVKPFDETTPRESINIDGVKANVSNGQYKLIQAGKQKVKYPYLNAEFNELGTLNDAWGLAHGVTTPMAYDPYSGALYMAFNIMREDTLINDKRYGTEIMLGYSTDLGANWSFASANLYQQADSLILPDTLMRALSPALACFKR